MSVITQAQGLLNKLTFDECITLYNKLETANPMMEYVMDRMEEIDPVRFEKWLDYEE